MLTVSPEFTAAAVATVRRPKGRVTITWADPYIDLGITVTVSDDNRVSYPAQVADLEESSARRWAILGQGIVADGTYYAMPGTEDEALDNQVGWIGETACDGSGDFSTPVTLDITFPPRPVLSLLLVGDDVYDEYPVDFTVTCYIGAALLRTDTITGNTSRRWTLDVSSSNMIEVDRMVLSVTKWSEPGHVVKITEFYSSIVSVYDGDDIISMDLLEESEVQNASIPVGNISANELTLALQNITDQFFPGNLDSILHTLMKQNRKIQPEIGFVLPDTSVEYVPLGTFWSGDWSTPELGTSATTTARDRMELMRRSTFDPGGVYEDYTLRELAILILEDARRLMPDMSYTIDADFGDGVVPYAYFKKTNHMAALRTVVTAALGRAYCDRSGVVIVESFVQDDITLDLEITPDQYFNREDPTNSDQVANAIEVTTQPLTPGKGAETIYTQKDPIPIEAGESYVDLEIKYSKVPSLEPDARAYLVDVDGNPDTEISITSEVYYAWGAILTVFNGAGVSGDFVVIATGKPLTIEGSEVVTVEDADSQREFGVMRYSFQDNPLVQTMAVAESIGALLLESYKQPRRDQSLDWCGNPAIEISDVTDNIIYQSSTLELRARFRAFRNKLSFDGTLRGTLESRKLYQYQEGLVYQGTNDSGDTLLQDTNSTLNPALQALSARI